MRKKIRQITNLRWSHAIYIALNVGLVLVVAFLVSIGLTPLALIVVVLSKWRMFAVQPRHWLVNIRSNSPDLIVGLSFVVFMSQAQTNIAMLLWIILYIAWLLLLKPKSEPAYVGAQALVSLFMGLTALFWLADSLPEIVIVLGAWFVASVSALHFLNGYDEPFSRIISVMWALFIAEMAWLMNRWLIVYPVSESIIIPQIAIVATVIGYISGTMYHLEQVGKLNKKLRRRYLVLGFVILLVIIIIGSSGWTNEL